jgi:uncharacterized protein YlzI (FlbEa/FlbD family)
MSFIKLTSALPAQEGTFYYLNPDLISSFYTSVEDPNKTVVYMIDGKTYDVIEYVEDIDSMCRGWRWGGKPNEETQE